MIPTTLFTNLPEEHMHVMFAEDIGGWLVAGSLLLGGLATSILALGALYPASQGKRF
jgi:hypothetical protein